MTQSTILVALFSASPETTSALNQLVKSIQDGYDLVPTLSAPEIHCLYSREGEAFQYQLVQHTRVEPVPGRNQITLCDMDIQLGNFFASIPVAAAVKSAGAVYLIIGAHGKPPGPTLGGIINQLPRFLMNLVSFLWLRSDYWPRLKDAWQALFEASLPVGAAYATSRTSGPLFISLTDLNGLLQTGFKNKPLKALVLHSCRLSTVETVLEINHTEQQVACESRLAANMDLSSWIPVAARGDVLRPLSGVILPAGGIFSSHKIQASDVKTLINYLNELGEDLKSRISGSRDQIETARFRCKVDSSEMVDIWKLCVQLNGICPSSVLTNLQAAITTIQLEHQELPAPTSPAAEHAHGISVFFPTWSRPAKIANLPSDFQTQADAWVAFLSAWVLP